MNQGITAAEEKNRAGGASRRNPGNKNNNDDIPPDDFGRYAMRSLAINAIALFLTNASVFACYQLPQLKENCAITDTENCVEEEGLEFSFIWMIPLVLAVLHFSWLTNLIIIPFVSPNWWRRLHFKSTEVGSGKQNEYGNEIMTRRWRATLIGWGMVVLALGITITTLVMSVEVVEKRCNPSARAQLKDTDSYNFFYDQLGRLAYNMTNNYGYSFMNFMSWFNPKYYIYGSMIFSIIFMGLATTPEMKRQAAAVRNKGYKAVGGAAKASYRQAAKIEGRAVRAGVGAAAATIASGVPGTMARRQAQIKSGKRDILSPTTKTTWKNIKAAQAVKRAQPIDAARKRKETFQAAAQKLRERELYKEAAPIRSKIAKRKFAGAGGQIKAATALKKAIRRKVSNRLAEEERQQKIDAFSQRVRERKGKDALTRLVAQQKEQAIKAKRPPTTPPAKLQNVVPTGAGKFTPSSARAVGVANKSTAASRGQRV